MSWDKLSEMEPTYFDLQAYTGATKHMGGMATTEELIEICHITDGSYVLDVGCGVGATPVVLAKRYGCRVVGVDINDGMIARARERVRDEGLGERIELRVADGRDLPFDDGQFDAVICESVATFIQEKAKVAEECARVIKSGGYAGLNEEIWIKVPPPEELIQFAKNTWDIEPEVPTADEWIGYLESAGLVDVSARVLEFNTRREATQVRRYKMADFIRAMVRTLRLYRANPAFRQYMAERKSVPKGFFEYLGYGLFSGRKP